MVGRRFCYGAVLVGCMVTAVPAAVTGPAVEPRAGRVLRETSALFGSAERFSFQVEGVRGMVAEGGQKDPLSRWIEVDRGDAGHLTN